MEIFRLKNVKKWQILIRGDEIVKNDKCLPFICIAFGWFFMDRPDNAFF